MELEKKSCIEPEYIARCTRVEEVNFFMSQGLNINRAGWEHLVTPLPRRPLNFITRDEPVNIPVIRVRPGVIRRLSQERQEYRSGDRVGVGSGSLVDTELRSRSSSGPRDRSRRRRRRRSRVARAGRDRSSTPFITTRGRGSPTFDRDSEEGSDYGKSTAKSKKRKGGPSEQPAKKQYSQDEWEELRFHAAEEDDLAAYFREYLDPVSPGTFSDKSDH